MTDPQLKLFALLSAIVDRHFNKIFPHERVRQHIWFPDWRHDPPLADEALGIPSHTLVLRWVEIGSGEEDVRKTERWVRLYVFITFSCVFWSRKWALLTSSASRLQIWNSNTNLSPKDNLHLYGLGRLLFCLEDIASWAYRFQSSPLYLPRTPS